MATVAGENRYAGGVCYAACQDVFQWFNPSIQQCWKGCDFATGRINTEEGREEAHQMCKRHTAELMWTKVGELDNIADLRVWGEMYPTEPINIYRACLAGTRRQKY